MNDFDGAKKFSNIILIDISNKTNYKVLLNPFHDRLLVAIENASGQKFCATIMDMSGKTIAHKNN